MSSHTEELWKNVIERNSLSVEDKIYIYIYIYCHPQTDCFVLSELFIVAWHVGCSKPGSKPIQLYVRLSLRSLGQQAYHIWLWEFLRYYVVTATAVCLHFYTLSATRVPNSFEELCIMWAAAENSFIYIYIQKFSCIYYTWQKINFSLISIMTFRHESTYSPWGYG